MCAVPNMAIFYSSLTSYFPGMLLTYFLNDFEIVPVAHIITGITFVFTFHMCCISVARSLYLLLSSSSLSWLSSSLSWLSSSSSSSKWDFPVYGCCTLFMTYQIYHSNSIIVAISIHTPISDQWFENIFTSYFCIEISWQSLSFGV